MLLAAAVAGAPACRKAPPPLAAGIDLPGMETSVAPGDDFNAYANGGWIKATPIPADKPSYGIFEVLADETRKRTLTLIQEAVQAGSAASGDTRKIADFYASFMDEAAIESKGIAPLKPQLDTIAAIADRHDLARVLGGQFRADVDPLNDTNFETGNLLGVWVTQGLTDPSHSFPYLLQGGLGMPDRDYYLSTTPHMTGRISRRRSSWRALRIRKHAPPACSRSKPRWRRCTPRASSPRTCMAWSRGDAMNWPPKPPGSTGRRCSTRLD
jgi:predicted metalloendopeptidase